MVMVWGDAPGAPSHGSAAGAWPPSWRQGCMWSLTKTESNPNSSARTEYFNNSVGPNCSAEALYPNLVMTTLSSSTRLAAGLGRPSLATPERTVAAPCRPRGAVTRRWRGRPGTRQQLLVAEP